MMEAARTSETWVDNYFTGQYIPEDNSELHTRRRENLKSHGSQLVHTRRPIVGQCGFRKQEAAYCIDNVVITTTSEH
jgi:hypothetical protein